MRVVLFDIDGTLISTGGAGVAALKVAFGEVFGVAEPREVDVSGRTDRGITRQLLQVNGLDDTLDNWQLFRAAYLRHLAALLPHRQGTVLPGARALVEHFAQQPDVAVGLLTGNVRDGAKLKLEHFDLFHHFQFGGFGDLHHDRDGVACEAFAAAVEHCNDHRLTADRVWVIGDTPLDVQCARTIGARVLAVATGSFSRDELALSQPDAVCNNLSDWRAWATLISA